MDHQLQIGQNAEQTYHTIRQSIVSAQHKLSAAVNSAMVTTYWEIGEQIYKACGENDRAEYGKRLLEYLSSQLERASAYRACEICGSSIARSQFAPHCGAN